MRGADTLDALLYAWLSEPDERRAGTCFAAYFRAAFPQLCRFARAWRVDPEQAEDLAQQALIKFFRYLGPERRAADAEIRQSTSALRPLDWGALHVRLVEGWVGQIRSFRDAAIGFRPAPASTTDPGVQGRDEINGRIEPLRRQGLHFLSEVRKRMAPRLGWLPVPTSATDSSETVGPDNEGVSRDADAIGAFASELLRSVEGKDHVSVERATDCAGGVQFVRHSSTVTEKLPVLAIPSNGLLYTIAKRQFLDVLRKKRPEPLHALEDLADRGEREVLDELDLGSSDTVDEVVEPAAPRGIEPEEAETGRDEVAFELRYGAFLDFLRAPLTRAEGALAAALAKGSGAKPERARVTSLQAKFDRVLAVLQALRESPQPTEDEIARRHGLTRNQVKYVIERIREEFNHFFPDLSRESGGRRKNQGSGA
jgi:DNA-directed RNA polymerase specialized sigma24 family protein